MKTINSNSTSLTVTGARACEPVAEVTPVLLRDDQSRQRIRFDKRISRSQRFPVEDQLARLPRKTHVGIFLDIRV